jgi:hypothetical protein
MATAAECRDLEQDAAGFAGRPKLKAYLALPIRTLIGFFDAARREYADPTPDRTLHETGERTAQLRSGVR